MTKTLEIDIRSAEGLKQNHKPIKKKRKTFAVIHIGEKSQRSNLDESGGSNPTWNYKSEIPMNGGVEFIFIEVCYVTGSRGSKKKLGEAKIPVTDFLGRYSPEGHFNFLCYRLRDEYGDKCGIVNLSILVKSSSSVTKDFGGACSSQAEENGLWRPRTDMRPEIGGYGRRIVTGVPVWWETQG